MDEDGFLQITDRLSRFSKIGGEMVPHIKMEEKLHELAGVTEQTFVVTGVPDEKKGERLVVLHKLPGAAPRCSKNLPRATCRICGSRSRTIFPRGEVSVARHGQAGFARRESARPKVFNHGWTRMNTD